MANQELINYIKKSLGSGTNQVAVRKALLGAGWPAADVDEAFYNIG